MGRGPWVARSSGRCWPTWSSGRTRPSTRPADRGGVGRRTSAGGPKHPSRLPLPPEEGSGPRSARAPLGRLRPPRGALERSMRCVSKRWWMKAGRSGPPTRLPPSRYSSGRSGYGGVQRWRTCPTSRRSSRRSPAWRSSAWRPSRTGSPPSSTWRAIASWFPSWRSWSREHPFRERLWRHLMTALYRSGRQADALAAFQRARECSPRSWGSTPRPSCGASRSGSSVRIPRWTSRGEPLRGYRLLEQVGDGGLRIGPSGLPAPGRPGGGHQDDPSAGSRTTRVHPAVRGRGPARGSPRASPHRSPLRLLAGTGRRVSGDAVPPRGEPPGAPRARARSALSDAARLLDQVAQALAAAHRQGVVHRDVKPANVLFDEEGNAYLSDFGIAKDVASPRSAPGERPVRSRTTCPPRRSAVSRPRPGPTSTASASCCTRSWPAASVRRRAPDEVLAQHLTEPVPSIREFARSSRAPSTRSSRRPPPRIPRSATPDARSLAAAFRAALVAGAARVATSSEVRNPYKGLRPFLEADAADFFGREELVARAGRPAGRERRRRPGSWPWWVRRAAGSRRVVRAGLVPALRGGAVPGSDRWFVVEMRPGSPPVRGARGGAAADRGRRPARDLLERLERGDLGLARPPTRCCPTRTPSCCS